MGEPVIDPRPRMKGLAAVIVVVIAGIALLVAASWSSAEPAGPTGSGSAGQASGPPVFAQDWGRSTTIVERPEEAFSSLDPSALVPEGSGRSGHPTHFPGQAIMADVARVPDGYVSVGYVYPGWNPVAWTSPDGEDWSLHEMGDGDYSFPVSIAVGPDGTIVAVGREGTLPVAWTSPDGASWMPHRVPILGTDGVAERMTTVIAVPGGFLAGGSVGPETLARHARFWHSADGVAWVPVPDDATAFDDAEVLGIARLGDGYVAIGPTGEAFKTTGSVAWTSPDGAHWTRVNVPALRTGRAAALAAGPHALVAVGAAIDERAAMAWTSPDGTTWTQAPDEPSRLHSGGFIKMNDVTVADGAFVAVGEYLGLQRPTMVVWSSPNGVSWMRAREVPVFEQCEPYAVVTGPVPAGSGGSTQGLVSVGSFGYPDDFIPTVWLSPAH